MRWLIFCEYVTDHLSSEVVKAMDKGVDVDIIATTPTACFQLDELDIKYKIPDDYAMPEEIDIEQLIESLSDCEGKELLLAFLIPISYSRKASLFWLNVLVEYLGSADHNVNCYHAGKDNRHLIDMLGDASERIIKRDTPQNN